MGQLIQCRIA